MATVADQQPVQALGPDGTHPPFGIRAFAMGAWGGIFSTATPAAVNTAGKAALNLASRSRTRNRNPAARSPNSISRVAGGLGDPVSGRVGGDPGQAHPAAVDLDDEQHVEPA
jgi:hypothetical protein